MIRFVTLMTIGGLLAASVGAGAQPGLADTSIPPLTAGTYGADPVHTRVQFSVSHLGFSTWYGDFSGITGSLDLDPANIVASKVDITIPVGSVTTTNAKLDGELKSAQWFDAAKYPTIHFVSTGITRISASRGKIVGNLTFHGITKQIVLDAMFNGAGMNPIVKIYTVGFDATATIKRSDFGVSGYVPMIGDDISLRISAPFELKSK